MQVDVEGQSQMDQQNEESRSNNKVCLCQAELKCIELCGFTEMMFKK